MRILLVLLAFSLLLVVPSQAQQVQQSVVIFHDVRADGYTYVGTPNQFAFALLNQDGSPNVHKNGRVVVTQNGVTLYETLGYSTAHDYDALNPFLVTFPVEGRYEIQAEIPITGAMLSANFSGYVERRGDLVPVALDVQAPAEARAGSLSKFLYSVESTNGSLVEHSDVLFEVREEATQKLLFRTHTHSHREPQVLEYAFPAAGAYSVRFVAFQAYPTKTDTAFAPVSLVKAVRVADGGSGVPAPPVSLPSMAATPAPSAGDYRMFVTYDPDRTVGMFGNMRLNAYVYDGKAKDLVAHVDFGAVLRGPEGRILFQSQTLHEYDGHLEVVTAHARPGTYRLDVEARRGDWKESRTLTFDVAPPVAGGSSPNVAFGAGPMLVTAKGLESLTAGTPQPITFTATTAAGTPWQHSEIELQVNTKEGVPVYLNKLHTHADGLFTVAVNFPEPGDYVLVLDAEPVHRDPATSTSYGRPGGSIVVPVRVGPGVEIPEMPLNLPPLEGQTAKGMASGAPLLAVLLSLAALCLGFHGRKP